MCASHAPGMARDPEAVQGQVFRQGLAEVRGLVADFDPELVVMFGVDHVRAYQPIVPAVSVIAKASGLGDAGSPTGEYDVPADQVVALAADLLAHDVDVALTHETVLDHGFGQTFADLLGSLGARPVVPVHINCAEEPMISCTRAVRIGELVGQHFAEDPRRILYLATGGLSHAPQALAQGVRGMDEEERRRVNMEGSEVALAWLNEDWDRRFLANIATTERGWIADMEPTMVEEAGCGANEVRSWLAAWAAGGRPLRTVAYEPVTEWITGMGVVAS
ncbi:hypothetical protein [Nocardioides marmotae]|nr:hypothetical protein [Nocardioides marmotae]